jgi:hypothetical protein
LAHGIIDRRVHLLLVERNEHPAVRIHALADLVA